VACGVIMAIDIKKKLLDEWTFSWPIMNVLIGGRSSIDLPEIQISGFEEATAFIKSYGYDPEKIHDARLMHAAICESLSFIERWLMPKEWKNGLQPPDEVLMCHDPRNLLLWACDRSSAAIQRRLWSCAILREKAQTRLATTQKPLSKTRKITTRSSQISRLQQEPKVLRDDSDAPPRLGIEPWGYHKKWLFSLDSRRKT
jgi:uncharacterized protein (TIGR04562 family)